MLVGEVNDLFLIDALHLTSALQRFARGRPGTAAYSAASSADALGELLRTLGLHQYATCARALSVRLRDPEVQNDLDSGRAAAATLTARLSDMIEELRHQTLKDDGTDFAAMWLAEYASTDPVDTPGVPATAPPAEPATEPAPDPSRFDEPVTTAAALDASLAERPVVDAEQVQDASDVPEWCAQPENTQDEWALAPGSSDAGLGSSERSAILSQARRLHAELVRRSGSAPEQLAADERVRQLVESLRMETRQIGSVVLARPLSASALALDAFAAAFEHLAVSLAAPLALDPKLACIDVAFPAPLVCALGAASEAIGQCGGRIDASPLGWRLTLPADTDRLSVVVIETEAGPLAFHALQFEAWVADESSQAGAPTVALPSGRLSLRQGAVEVELPLQSPMASFSAPEQTLDVWRFELPPAQQWPCPCGWVALVVDASGRVMPLLVPQAVRSGEQYQLNAFDGAAAWP
jgi:hypothetical protein